VINQSLELFRSKLWRIKHLRNTIINVWILDDNHPGISNLNWNSITLLIELINKFSHNLNFLRILFIMAVKRIKNFLFILKLTILIYFFIVILIFLFIININIRLCLLLKHHLLLQVLIIFNFLVTFFIIILILK